MRMLFVCALVAPTFSCGCREPPEPPSQAAVEAAWQRADRASEEALAAREDAKHAARLRDIDRMRHAAEEDSFLTQLTTLRGFLFSLGVTLFAALIWLAIEIRRRRIASAVSSRVISLHEPVKGGDPLHNERTVNRTGDPSTDRPPD